MRKMIFSLVALFCIAAFINSSMAADGREVIEKLPNGVINWSQGMVTAKGSGAPPTGITVPAQARLMAERAAKADALRNLLEAVKGVRVDAETTVESFTTKNDVVMTRVSGIVKGATVIDRRYLSDGGVEVTVGVNLTGELLAVML
ncbi:MAG: LPP20 family lipoprotein, partial [Deltaproteobacteria bacterium]|nr:LPP20 family lipoprotein [Deltaproteobacteria bacterium]